MTRLVLDPICDGIARRPTLSHGMFDLATAHTDVSQNPVIKLLKRSSGVSHVHFVGHAACEFPKISHVDSERLRKEQCGAELVFDFRRGTFAIATVTPIEQEAATVPLDDSLWLYELHPLFCFWVDAVKPTPKKTIGWGNIPGSPFPAPKDGKLMPKGDNLKLQRTPLSEAQGQKEKQRSNNQAHAGRITPKFTAVAVKTLH